MNSQPNVAIAQPDARSLSANRAYSVPELAEKWDVGARPLYREIREGRLKAAPLNGRGDLRVLGQWALDYLETRALQRQGATA